MTPIADDVREGLWKTPPTLPARWFYDERGSRLFDEITRLPEYYPTRRETEILDEYSADIVKLTGATTVLELGSGTSTKTRLLLSAFTADERELRFVPLDVSAEVLTESAEVIAADYPGITVVPVVADFNEPFAELPGTPGERLVIFLGGTIGNFDDDERAAFLARIRAALAPGDHFLLGADLVKPPSRLIAAYDDSAGITAEFNRNLIEVLRAELDAQGLYVDDFQHIARWNPVQHRVEMWLRARRGVSVHFAAIDRDWTLPEGAEMLTEISVKFRLPELHAELGRHGFEIVESWTDDDHEYSLTLAVAR
ncbi:MAG TPA: L-histidine N(alpha)-methyltransferase [Jatrophihabitans sp.]|jgi:L-histidine N-alpha-methyltransferase